MKLSDDYNKIFDQAISKYHIIDRVDQPFENIYKPNGLEYLLYAKCWIDIVQWHYEDSIRSPNIDPIEALILKRKIDKSNQNRTDIVENIDSYFFKKYRNVNIKSTAKINSESPAWAIDRLSILALKIYHMKEEVIRVSASDEHKTNCQIKLNILLEQRKDLSKSIDDLIIDIKNGHKYMKVYKQMKMYNDNELNPTLYSKKN